MRNGEIGNDDIAIKERKGMIQWFGFVEMINVDV